MDKKHFYETFKLLYENNKINITWRRNSYGVFIDNENDLLDVKQIEEFKKMLDKLITCYLTDGKKNEDFYKYVELLKKEMPLFENDMLIKLNSTLNSITLVDIKQIKYTNLEEENLESWILNLNYIEPIKLIDNEKAITFELSKQDISDLILKLKEIEKTFD